ncbi:hypothetical protein JIG36_37365 [Actinoplanes sp. LDG1-06]|uniref:Uncharacterized protein n=1 Tax=Paractinoplanes ovalisporus TaxID=2810368 RepID=A0ABS2AMW0_9ACTN|nr:hypothetical protein [Actinoplanes ovalisporus]MBM2621187.1 hypothetical protein [Actinoplanes ovalisporus]
MSTPPALPPENADPMVWALARQVWIDHMPDRDGFCVICKEWSPCGPRESAGIAIALGAQVSWDADAFGQQ